MQPKPKAVPKQRDTEAKLQDETSPKTVNERSAQVYSRGNPYSVSIANSGPSGLPPAERNIWASVHFTRSPGLLKRLGNKPQREAWKVVNEANGLPFRALKNSKKSSTAAGSYSWGTDRFGADLGEYSPEQFAKRSEKALQLAALEVQRRAFLVKRERERGQWVDPSTKQLVSVSAEEIGEERLRRREIAELRMELYGERTGSYSSDPEWDDVIPMLVEDGEGTLAAIAYPDDYAEAISYLRAVMAKKEYSPRCLRLTQDIISMNPAHYTVWLYRFSIVQALNIPLPEEIEWLNQVSLENLKNYQIWHHRRLLLDHYFPTIKSSPDQASKLARSEQQFLTRILAEDTKNYHVWSYRQYMVPKLDIFGETEIQAADDLINQDVRNNSAWSHRFFVVLSDPKHSTPQALPTEYDPKLPAEIIDREIKYAQDKILWAPQNQSPWNYLRGVLVKSGRNLSSVEEFASQFVTDLGTEKEAVTSTHGLELLAEIYAEKGETDKASLCLERLGEKWDRIRLGYWQWKKQLLKEEKSTA